MKQLTLGEALVYRGIRPARVAELTGLSKSTVSRLIRGLRVNPSNDTVATLERALRLRRGTLVFGRQVKGRAA